MTNRFAFLLLPFAVLISDVIAQNTKGTCESVNPLPPALLGRTYSMKDDCFRPMSESYVSIHRKMFIVTLYEGIPLQCPEAYLFIFREPRMTPTIVKYPKIDVNISELGSSVTGELVTKFCETTQKLRGKEILPVGGTKRKFAAAVKKMLPILREIRDFGCTTDEEGFIVQVEGRAYENVDVETVIGYLYSVAYEYRLCI